jgi:hypothetical protein
VAVDQVAAAPADSFVFDVSSLNQVGDDALSCAFSD